MPRDTQAATLDTDEHCTTPTPQTLARWNEAKAWLTAELNRTQPCCVVGLRLVFDNGQIKHWYPRQSEGKRPSDVFLANTADAGLKTLEESVLSIFGRNWFGEVVFTAGWRDGKFLGWCLEREQSR